MFGGIVETSGFIETIEHREGCKYFTITPSIEFNDLIIGESIAINGVCLTVTSFTKERFHVTAVPETLRLTNLNFLEQNDTVNLERALKVNSRIGGHYVQGHVDCMGEIIEMHYDQSDALIVKIKNPSHFAKYIVKKGYITLDGMSITVIDTTQDWFTVTLIPHTQKVTITNRYVIGTLINIEVDIMGKYIEKILEGRI